MGIDNNNYTGSKEPAMFHDFLGGGGGGCKSCDADPPVELALPSKATGDRKAAFGDAIRLSEPTPSASGGPFSSNLDLGSERHYGRQHESFRCHSRSDLSVPETSNRFIGSKRINSDASFTRTPREGIMMPQVESESIESSHPSKNQILWNQASGEQARIMLYDKASSHVPHQMRLGPGSIPQISSPQIGTTSNVNLSKWEKSVVLSIGGGTRYSTSAWPVINSPSGYQVPSSVFQDSRPGPLILSQKAFDEGSRTGIESSRLSSLTPTDKAFSEKNPSLSLLSNDKIKLVTSSAELEAVNNLNQHGPSSVSRQMTIIYGGLIHVFNDVQPNKADIIMSLAGSDSLLVHNPDQVFSKSDK